MISSEAAGVNTNILTINNITQEDIGNYRYVASNASGRSFSNYATLSINGIVLLILNIVIMNFTEFFGCAMEIDEIYGLSWPNMKAGEAAIVNCSANIGTATATRLCNNEKIWERVDASNCLSDSYSDLLKMVKHIVYV